MTWRLALATWIRANYAVGQEFSLTELYRRAEPAMQTLFPRNRSVQPTMRNELQKLRDEGLVAFVDGHGTYRRIS